jgi:hypothetical protein
MSQAMNIAARARRNGNGSRAQLPAFIFVAVLLLATGLALAPFGPSVDRAAAPPAASAPTAASRADSSVPDASAVFAVPHHATDEAAPTF